MTHPANQTRSSESESSMTITLSELSDIDLPIYPNSLVEDGEATYFLARSGDEKRLCIMAPAGSMALGAFSGAASAQGKQSCWFAR